jgi:hypothetical protein
LFVCDIKEAQPADTANALTRGRFSHAPSPLNLNLLLEVVCALASAWLTSDRSAEDLWRLERKIWLAKRESD